MLEGTARVHNSFLREGSASADAPSACPPMCVPAVPSLCQDFSLDEQPSDFLEQVVEMLAKLRKRPCWVAAFCSCNRALHGLMPVDLQKQWLDHALSRRPSSSDVRRLGVLKSLFDRQRAELQKAMTTSAVSCQLRLRPEPDVLLERGLLKAKLGTSPSLITAREQVQRKLTAHTLERTLASNLVRSLSTPSLPSSS